MHWRTGGLLALTLASACAPVTFDATVTGSGVVQGSPLGSVLGAFPTLSGLTSIDFNSQQDFQNNQTTRDHVQSLKLTSLVLKVLSPTSQDFGFLDALTVTAKAGANQIVAAEKAGIAQSPGTPPNATLTFDVKDVELAPLLKEPTFTLELSGSGRQPPQDTRIEATAVLRVAPKL